MFLAREDGADVDLRSAACGATMGGTHTSPVGYLEGVFVQEEYWGRGVATALLRACEAWAGEKRLCRICKRLWAGQRRKRRVSSARRLCRGGAHHLLHKAAVRNVESEPLRDA